MLIPMTRKTGFPSDTPGLVLHIRRRGQRWFRLCCFGAKGHYYADGSCDHTDALWASLTDYGKKVTSLEPFGNGIPKRARSEKHRQKFYPAPPTEGEG